MRQFFNSNKHIMNMKKVTQIIISFICLALFPAAMQASTNYWDINGATPGAGGPTPYNIWDTGTTPNWTTDPTGASATTTWADGNDAVFSAGNDATGTYDVSFESDPTVRSLTVEEGDVTFGDYNYTLNLMTNSAAGQGTINIASGASLHVQTAFAVDSSDYDPDTGYLLDGWMTKTGTGTLVFEYWNYHSSLIIKEGIVGIANNAATFGTAIVSNGAALYLLSPATGSSGTKILNGSGVNNTGAFRNLGGGNVLYSSGATLASDARIQHDGNGSWDWWNTRIVGNNVNLTIGGDGEQRIRLNIFYPSVNIGTGAIIKEGKCKLQLEQPNYCGAFYLNDGSVYPRNEAQPNGFGTNNLTPIFVEGVGGAFSADFQDINLSRNLLVAAGANVGFNCNRYVDGGIDYKITWNGVISGQGGLWKTNWGTLFLNQANTYNGNTTIQWGFLTLGATGSISNSPVIDVWSGGTFNVTSNASPFVLGAAQTLKGNGTNLGNMTAYGTISPGASIGTLAFNGNLTLASGSKLLVEVDKAQVPTGDLITVSGTLSKTGSGTVTVSNLNPGVPLEIGDSFQLFNKPVSNGQLMSVVGGGAIWTNKLAVNGTIAVVKLAPSDPTITSITGVGTTSVTVNYSNTIPGESYTLQYRTTIMGPWITVGSKTAVGTTDFQTDNTANGAERYYRVVVGALPPQPFITSIAGAGTASVTVNYNNCVAGKTYYLQYKSPITGTWTTIGAGKVAAGTSDSQTDNTASGSQRYYRVYGQF